MQGVSEIDEMLISAHRAKRELNNRHYGSAGDAEAALVDGGLDR